MRNGVSGVMRCLDGGFREEVRSEVERECEVADETGEAEDGEWEK